MATKVSDLFLDMETGDACIEDAYIEQSKAKIGVSNAIFEAAYKNSELPDDGQFACYLESAENGIPTQTNAATGTACEAVIHELDAFYDGIIATAKKVKDASEKNLKSLIAVGKKVGVSMSEDFERGFAEPLGKAVVTSRRLDLSDDKFLKGAKTVKIAKAYAKGMCYAMGAYGVKLGSDIRADVKSFTGAGDCKTASCIKSLEGALSDAGRALNVGESADEKGATGSIKAADITDLAMACWATANVADAVLKAGKSAKKDAANAVRSFCKDDAKPGKISRTAEAINGDIAKYMTNLENCGKAIATGFTNSAYVLMNTVLK